MEEGEEEDREDAAEINVGTLELNVLSLAGSDESSEPPAPEEEGMKWGDWMQDPVLDPWSCSPCQPGQLPNSFKLPTLKDLYGWKQLCLLCDKAGVYETAISKQRPEQFINLRELFKPVASLPQGPPQPLKPVAPMPKGPPRTIVLASCVAEPPEDEVLEWAPPSPEEEEQATEGADADAEIDEAETKSPDQFDCGDTEGVLP